MAAKLGRLAVNNTAFLLCDIQEKFRPSIRYFPEIIKVAQRMVSYLGKTINMSNKPECKQLRQLKLLLVCLNCSVDDSASSLATRVTELAL